MKTRTLHYDNKTSIEDEPNLKLSMIQDKLSHDLSCFEMDNYKLKHGDDSFFTLKEYSLPSLKVLRLRGSEFPPRDIGVILAAASELEILDLSFWAPQIDDDSAASKLVLRDNMLPALKSLYLDGAKISHSQLEILLLAARNSVFSTNKLKLTVHGTAVAVGSTEQIDTRSKHAAKIAYKMLDGIARSGCFSAQHLLAEYFESGNGIIKKNLNFSRMWYDRATMSIERLRKELAQTSQRQIPAESSLQKFDIVDLLSSGMSFAHAHGHSFFSEMGKHNSKPLMLNGTRDLSPKRK